MLRVSLLESRKLRLVLIYILGVAGGEILIRERSISDMNITLNIALIDTLVLLILGVFLLFLLIENVGQFL
jgi:hypothetical protein